MSGLQNSSCELNHQYLNFCNWLTSLSILKVYPYCNIWQDFPFWGCIVFHRMYIPLILYPSVCENLGYLYLLAIENKVAMNVCMLCRSVVSDSLLPCRLYPAKLLCPWDSPGKSIVWVAIPFSRGFSQLRDWSRVSCIAGRYFTAWVTMELYCANISLRYCFEIFWISTYKCDCWIALALKKFFSGSLSLFDIAAVPFCIPNYFQIFIEIWTPRD